MIPNANGSGIAALQFDQYRFSTPAVGSGEDRIREAAQEFEALFIKQMLDSMKKTLNKDNQIVETGMAGDIFDDMLYDEYAKVMSKTAGLGLADMIIEQIRQ